MRRVILSLVLLLWTFISYAQTDITPQEVMNHIKYLAADDKKGRFPCSPESHQVSDYIRDQFAQYGLELMADSGFQYFDITIGAEMTGTNYLKIKHKTFTPGQTTYLPFAFSATGTFKSDTVIFVGYGFDINQGDTLIWNDYDGINVKGKWVVAFTGFPKDTLNKKFFSKQISERNKASLAQEKGAIGIIFVNPEKDELIPFVLPRFSVKFKIAILEVSRGLTRKLLKKDIDKLKAALKKNPHYHLTVAKPVEAAVNYEIKHCKARNVVALLKSNDPEFGNRYIVIGAHYDHLGMGGYESGSRMPDTIAVHNGADDNASGTTGVLELAEYLSSLRDSLKRSIIFITFDAEERGLLGSDYFAKHPTVPKDKIDFMINMDMIGQCTGKASIMGVGTAKEAKKIFESVPTDTTKLKIKLYDRAFGGSDHASFISQGIPAVFFYASKGDGYHTPFDDIDKINPECEADLLKYIAKIAVKLSDYPGEFTFVEQKDKSEGQRYGQGVKLGIRPSFTYSGEGVQIDGLVSGGAAEKAGLQNGDIIIRIGKTKITNIYDYMNALQNYKPGDTAKITVLRKGKEMTIQVKF